MAAAFASGVPVTAPNSQSIRVQSILVAPDRREAVVTFYEAQGWKVTEVNTFRCFAPDGLQVDFLIKMERPDLCG